MANLNIFSAQKAIIDKIFLLSRLLAWTNRKVKKNNASGTIAKKNSKLITSLHRVVANLSSSFQAHSGLDKILPEELPKYLSREVDLERLYKELFNNPVRSIEDFILGLDKFFNKSMLQIKRKEVEKLQKLPKNEFKNKALVLLAYYKLYGVFPRTSGRDYWSEKSLNFGYSSPRSFYGAVINMQHQHITGPLIEKSLKILDLKENDLDYECFEFFDEKLTKNILVKSFEKSKEEALKFIKDLINEKKIL